MTQTDKVYSDLLQDILKNGVEKDTRAGKVKSVFGRQLRFDLKAGFPLLTTKKVFTKGVIHELLWFLQRPCNSHGSMNIEYLVRNGVHIWDDDAYRWFKDTIVKKFPIVDDEKKGLFNLKGTRFMVCTNDDETRRRPAFEYWIEGDAKRKDKEWLSKISKEEFIDLTLQKVEIWGDEAHHYLEKYRFGDLGPVYGKQWRLFGREYIDQIQNIITTLRRNPNDRRMLCLAFNPDEIDNMALPPCHVMFQFYTRELSISERVKYITAKQNYVYTHEELDELDIPKYGLSCMWTQRSVDTFLGLPFNIASYALLTHIIARLVNMVPDELIGSLGDCHIYEPHFDAVKEQLSRNGSSVMPELLIKHNGQNSVEDFKYDDFEIVSYMPDPPIKAPLQVG